MKSPVVFSEESRIAGSVRTLISRGPDSDRSCPPPCFAKTCKGVELTEGIAGFGPDLSFGLFFDVGHETKVDQQRLTARIPKPPCRAELEINC